MGYEYIKNEWEGFKEDVLIDKQPNAIITEEKLNKMERGIERNSMTLEPGNITITDKETPDVSITVDEISHTRKLNIAFPKVSSDSSGADINDNISESNSTWSSKKIENMFNNIQDQISDLNYKPISITSFSNNINTVEKGRVFETISLNWSTNKQPTKIVLNGIDIDINLKSTKLIQTIKDNTSFVLSVTDEKSKSASATTSVSFVNGIYYGVGINRQLTDIDSEFVLSNMTKRLSGSMIGSFSANAGNNQYIYFIYPSSFGKKSFYVGGFEGGFDYLGEFLFTNQYNYNEKYIVYKSTNSSLGDTNVQIK